jgi:hypothetical protein
MNETQTHKNLSANHDVPNVKCYAYFGGKDGKGTCNSACQWFRENVPCEWWKP